MRETLLSFLDDCLARGGDAAVVRRRGLRLVTWSSQEIARRAFQFARELEARGISHGDRVLFWGENSAEWIAAFFGCLLRGVVVVPLDLKSAPDFAARVQQQVSAKLLLADERQPQILIPTLLFREFVEIVGKHSAERYAPVEVKPDDLVEIVFTSGTTAEPKGVCLTHRNLLANLTPIEKEFKNYAKWERLVHPLRFLCLLPLSHVFGQLMGIFVPQIVRGEVHFLESFKPSEIIDVSRKHRINAIVTVPRVLETLREKILSDYGDLARDLEAAEHRHFAAQLVDLPAHSSQLRLAAVGVHQRRRNAGRRRRDLLASTRLRRHSRLRHDRNGFAYVGVTSLSSRAWFDWKAGTRAGTEAQRERRDSRAWRQRLAGLLE